METGVSPADSADTVIPALASTRWSALWITAGSAPAVILSARAGVEAANRPAKDLASGNGRDVRFAWWGVQDEGRVLMTVSRCVISALTKARSFATHRMGFDTADGAQDDGGRPTAWASTRLPPRMTAGSAPAVILSAGAGVEAANRPAKDLASGNGRDVLLRGGVFNTSAGFE